MCRILKRQPMLYVRSLSFHCAVLLTGAVFVVLFWPAVFAPRRIGVWVINRYLKAMLWQLRVICGLSFEVRGLERLPAGGFVCACNHQSAWETFSLMAILNDPALVLKKELRWIPGLGLIVMKTGQIWIDRAGCLSSTERMLNTAEKVSKTGRPVVIFPEGTRVPVDGCEPYKPGVFMLYRRLGVPCVPTAVNSGLFWPRKGWVKYPGKITLEFFDPIEPNQSKDEFFVRLEGSLREGVRRLVDEVVGA